MKHAYLIIAHSGWAQLENLIGFLDSEFSDIYIHIDKKAIDVPLEALISAAKISNVYVWQKYKVYWGSFELVEAELFLFDKAHKGHYDYYHLLSGADLPIKSQQEIYEFFEKNAGYEFVHFDKEERLESDRELVRRTQLYHFLQNYRRRYNVSALNSMFTFMERILLVVQIVFRVNRMKQYPTFKIRYGSQWVSITDDLVAYILEKQSLIEHVFRWTNCADELFIQSLIHNSNFQKRLYRSNYDDSIYGNMRLIDMKSRGANGNPYTWRLSDEQEILESRCLFARKFDGKIDKDIIDVVAKRVR